MSDVTAPGDRISVQRAQILLDETIMAEVPAQGYEGRVSRNPTRAYPENLVFIVDRYNSQYGLRVASKFRFNREEQPDYGEIELEMGEVNLLRWLDPTEVDAYARQRLSKERWRAGIRLVCRGRPRSVWCQFES